MGGCEIPLTDPSVAPLAPNIPFVAITSRDHLRSGGRAADADPPRANNALRSWCAVPGGEAGSHTGGAGTDHMTDVPDIPAGRFGSSPPCSRWAAGEVGPRDHGSAMDHQEPVTTCHLPGRQAERSHERKGSFVIM